MLGVAAISSSTSGETGSETFMDEKWATHVESVAQERQLAKLNEFQLERIIELPCGPKLNHVYLHLKWMRSDEILTLNKVSSSEIVFDVTIMDHSLMYYCQGKSQIDTHALIRYD
jgi:hypothetical protein